MIVVVITGGIATGKSYCLNVFKQRGFVAFSADDISHDIANTDIARVSITKAFNIDFYSSGVLDRQALGKYVFAQKSRLDKLNNIMHKLIYNRIFELINQYQYSQNLMAIEIPLLYETNMQHIADYVINCWLPYDIQLYRLIKRNGLTEMEAKRRIASQMSMDVKKSLADFNVDATMSFEDTSKYVNDIIDTILQKENNDKQ